MIDEEMQKMAEMLRTEFNEGTVMVDVRVISEIIKGIASTHAMAVAEGRIREDDPRIIGQTQVGLLLLRVFQAIIAKHAEEIAEAKFKNADIENMIALFEQELTDDEE